MGLFSQLREMQEDGLGPSAPLERKTVRDGGPHHDGVALPVVTGLTAPPLYPSPAMPPSPADG